MISNLASVHPEAKLAGNITVDPFAVIEADVEIGEGSIISSHACILSGTRLGKNCRVFQGAVVGGIPQETAQAPLRPNHGPIGPSWPDADKHHPAHGVPFQQHAGPSALWPPR